MANHLSDECLFCKIIQGKIPSHKLLETDLNYVLLDINPLIEGHTLIIPKYHSSKMDEVPDEYLAEILPLAKKIALANGIPDYNILQNNGKIAFQHVFHVHFHVIPRTEEEGLQFVWDPRKVERPQEELVMTAQRIKAALSNL